MVRHKNRELLLIIQDCVTYRLREKEALEYIGQRYGQSISRGHYYRLKRHLESDEELNYYFDEHARIGFVKDHYDRANEIKSVMTELMRRWFLLSKEKNPDIYKMVRLSEVIINASKRLEEISLANPVIAKIKAKVDSAVNRRFIGSDSEIDYTEGTAFS